MDGAWLGSVDIAQKKAKTARFFDMNTGEIGKLSQPGGSLYNIEHSNGGLITFPGGVPLTNKDGVIIGAIGVSGSTVENDHAVASAGAARAVIPVPARASSAPPAAIKVYHVLVPGGAVPRLRATGALTPAPRSMLAGTRHYRLLGFCSHWPLQRWLCAGGAAADRRRRRQGAGIGYRGGRQNRTGGGCFKQHAAPPVLRLLANPRYAAIVVGGGLAASCVAVCWARALHAAACAWRRRRKATFLI